MPFYNLVGICSSHDIAKNNFLKTNSEEALQINMAFCLLWKRTDYENQHEWTSVSYFCHINAWKGNWSGRINKEYIGKPLWDKHMSEATGYKNTVRSWLSASDKKFCTFKVIVWLQRESTDELKSKDSLGKKSVQLNHTMTLALEQQCENKALESKRWADCKQRVGGFIPTQQNGNARLMS